MERKPPLSKPGQLAITSWEWNNGRKPRGRYPACLVVRPTGEVHRFEGQDIPGLVRVASASYVKAGKWSSTTYRCFSPSGTAVVDIVPDWDTGAMWPQATWDEGWKWFSQRAPGARRESWERVVREHWPSQAQTWDETDSAIAAFSLES